MNTNTLQQLLDISRRMAETRDLVPLLNYAMGVALELVAAERGYLVMVEEDGGLDFRVRLDRDGNLIEHPAEQISFSILNKVLHTLEPQLIQDAMVDPNLGGPPAWPTCACAR
ncbi:MAG: hypothetical protein HC915_16660 [Anaerolineae bacterium]|nr:hypothetical protein [Anaerolineae bacterium]